jgi:hypothetical protein
MPPKKVLITNFRGPHTTLVDVPNNNINVKTSTLTTQEKVKIDTKEINYEYPEPELDMDDNRTPDTINITYKYDVNIILIHEVIRKKFAFERGKLNNYEVKIKQIDKINPNSLSLNEYKRLQKDKLELLNKIEEINIGRKWELYVSRARPYLEAYQSLPGQRNRNLVIIGKKVEKEEDKTNIENRLSIIKSYINIASESIDINASKIEKNIAVCPVCETEFKDFEIDEDIGICTCTGCGWFRENLAKSSCTRNDVPSGKEVRSQPTIKGRKKGVNFSMMIRALATLSKPRNPALNYREIYSEYYEDVWLIMHNYWGFTPNNIMHLIPDLMDIYDRTQKEYIALTTAERGGRDASLNTQYRLCVQLLALGFPCQKSDFKIQTRESLENHQRIWKIMCARSGVKFHEII